MSSVSSRMCSRVCRRVLRRKTLSVCARDVCVGGGQPTCGLAILYGRSSLSGFAGLLLIRASAFKIECRGLRERVLSEGFRGVDAVCNSVRVGLNCLGNRLVGIAPRCRSYGVVTGGKGVSLVGMFGRVGYVVTRGFFGGY